MQSTGHTSTQERSLMSMQGSAMMYVIGAHSSVARWQPWRLLRGQLVDDLRSALLQGILHQHLVEPRLVRAAEACGIGVAAEADDRDLWVRVRDIVRIDTADVGDDEIRPVGAVGRYEVMPRQESLQLPLEEDIDPTEQDRRHGGSVSCSWVLLLVSRPWSSSPLHASRTSRPARSRAFGPATKRSRWRTATAVSTPSRATVSTCRGRSARDASNIASSPAPGTAGSTTSAPGRTSSTSRSSSAPTTSRSTTEKFESSYKGRIELIRRGESFAAQGVQQALGVFAGGQPGRPPAMVAIGRLELAVSGDDRVDEVQRRRRVEAVRVPDAVALAVGHERVVGEDDVRPAEKIGTAGVAEAGAALVDVVLDERVADRVVAGDQSRRREEPREGVAWGRLARAAARAASVDEVLDAVADEVDARSHRERVDKPLGRQCSVLALRHAGRNRPAAVVADERRNGAARRREDHDGNVVGVEARQAPTGAKAELRIEVVATDEPDTLG